MAGGWRPWRQAMAESLYGDGGFYRAAGVPGRHFRTSAHASGDWAAAVAELATRVEEALGRPSPFTVCDVGAGGGELLAALAAVAPARWSLVGVDVAPRPAPLPERVRWLTDPPGRLTGLLLAVELLDVVPVDAVELGEAGPGLVEVADDGSERLGGELHRRDAEWLARWWPPAGEGDRAEPGWPRDACWRRLTAGLERGLAVAVDYAVVPGRDLAGTLTGYRDGRQVGPVPDGSCDITAHVLMESLAEPGDVIVPQHEVLRCLGVSAARPRYTGNPSAYLRSLSAVGEAAELLDPGGLGGFSWLLHPKSCDLATLLPPLFPRS